MQTVHKWLEISQGHGELEAHAPREHAGVIAQVTREDCQGTREKGKSGKGTDSLGRNERGTIGELRPPKA